MVVAAHAGALHVAVGRIELHIAVGVYFRGLPVPVEGVGLHGLLVDDVVHYNVAERFPDLGFGILGFDLSGYMPGVVGHYHRFQTAVGGVGVERDSLGEGFIGGGVGLVALHHRGFHAGVEHAVLALYGEHVLHGLHRGFGQVDGRGLPKLSLTGKRQDGKRRNACHPE